MAQLISREELFKLNLTMNVSDIADMLKITRQAVESRFQRMGVTPIRHKVNLDADILFLQQFPVKIIAAKLEIKEQKVYGVLRKYDIKPTHIKAAQDLLPDVKTLKGFLSEGYSYRVIGLKYNVSLMTVWRKVNETKVN